MHVIIYTKDDCQYCYKAKKLLQESGLEYDEIKVGEDVPSEVYRTMFEGHTTVPAIIINEAFIGGYTELREYL